MDDMISRQAAIDAVGDVHPLDYNAMAVVERLRNLPSAQPESRREWYMRGYRDAQRWIPVTEELPDAGQWVLCQCRANIIDVLRLTDDGCWYRKSNEIYMSGFVLAWMPLPEPWRGEEHEL